MPLLRLFAVLAAAHSGLSLVEGHATSEQQQIEVVFLLIGKGLGTPALHTLAKHLEASTAAPVRFHLVTDEARPEVEPWASVHMLDRMPADAAALHTNFTRLSHGPGAMYMWKPLLHRLLKLDRVMVLDQDLLLTTDLLELWRQFDAFDEHQLLGLAVEQAPSYTEPEYTHPQRGPLGGLNGGVQLLHLGRMRGEAAGAAGAAAARGAAPAASPAAGAGGGAEYEQLLATCAAGGCGRIGYLGDQTFYSKLRARAPQLFFDLPCGWNRQLSLHYWNDKRFRERHACASPTYILHGNQPNIKPLIVELQERLPRPRCADCRASLQSFKKKNGEWGPAYEYMTDLVVQGCCRHALHIEEAEQRDLQRHAARGGAAHAALVP